MITETVAYLVPFDRLRRTAGSHDQKLIEAIATTCADFLAEADQNRAEGHTRTCGEALADLIHGADLSKVPDSERYLYGLALEAMCAYLGEYAGAVEGHWNDVLDDYFAAQDVALKYSDLVFGDPVVRIPAYTDYPQVGSWPPEAVAAAVAPLQVLDLPVLREEDEEMAEAVAEVVAWVTKASGHAGWGILGFSL